MKFMTIENLRVYRGVSIAVVFGCIYGLGWATPGNYYNIGARKQLFIDNKFIASSEGVELKMNPPVKRGIVLTGDRPWDAGFITHTVSVLEEDGRYRMFYRSYGEGALIDGKFGKQSMCYAESTDGINWEKPALGLKAWEGDEYSEPREDTNILPIGEGTVFLDPSASPDERYKILQKHLFGGDKTVAGFRVGSSPDGYNWNMRNTRVFPFLPDTTNQLFYDVRIKKYVSYFRTWAPLRKVGRLEIENIYEPWPYDNSIEPNYIWGKEKTPTPSYEFHQAVTYDDRDPPDTDIYCPSVQQYEWADDVYFSFPNMYRHFSPPPVGKFANDGLLDIQLAVSRNGVNFERPFRAPYIPLGLKGDGDGGSLYMLIGMIRRGADIYHYYTGYDASHGEIAGFDKIQKIASVFLAVQRLDGFVSADFAYNGGAISTPNIVFDGSSLQVNADASALGELRIGLRDANGYSIPGFSVEDCDPVIGNSIAATVSWKGSSDVSSLSGKPVTLYFVGRAVKLYAFQFIE